jgi:hypothetical protein
MDTLSKNDQNETVETSERIKTFDITFQYPDMDTKSLKKEAIRQGFYFSPNDSSLLKTGIHFLSNLSSELMESLPKIEHKEKIKKGAFITVWETIVDNPDLDSTDILNLFPEMNATTARLAISWLGSVTEYLGTHQNIESVELFRTNHKALRERARTRKTVSQTDVMEYVSNMDPISLINALGIKNLQEIVSTLDNDSLLSYITEDQYKHIKKVKTYK